MLLHGFTNERTDTTERVTMMRYREQSVQLAHACRTRHHTSTRRTAPAGTYRVLTASGVGGAADGHSLLDRRTLSASDAAVDDRTGEIGERKRRCTVLTGVDAAGFREAFLSAVAPPEPLVNVSLPLVKETTHGLRTYAVPHPLKA